MGKDASLEDATDFVSNAKYLIALTGSGISKESNIPTFRGKDGLWRHYDVTQLATPRAFTKDPKLVWEWYGWRQELIGRSQPNPGHTILAKWEQIGLLKGLITQNVDGLHRRAGSKKVLEVHGDLWVTKCTSCSYYGRLDAPAESIPMCPECGGHLRPNVVWFGESLDPLVMREVYAELEKADVCLVIGTSAIVQPAGSFPIIVKQRKGTLIEVNVEHTPLTPIVDVHLHGKAGEVLPLIDSLL